MLRPFFSYFGSKWRVAPHYPQPEHDTIIEPFAGSACYSVRHPERKVILYDVDPKIFGVWSFLIRASESEILSLPLEFETTDDLSCCDEAKWLIGFWVNKGASQPCKRPSAWNRKHRGQRRGIWEDVTRQRLADQVKHIRHWRILNQSWDTAEIEKATWFVDPPYSNQAGRCYKFNAVDYAALAAWCRSLPGQAIVCENEGATWLPFQAFRSVLGTNGTKRTGRSAEAVWVNRY